MSERLGALGPLHGNSGRRRAELIGERLVQDAAAHDIDALAAEPVRPDRLVGMIARDRLVDDRDELSPDTLAGAKAAVAGENGGTERIGLGCVAERFVGEPLRERVVDQQRVDTRRVAFGATQPESFVRRAGDPSEELLPGVLAGQGVVIGREQVRADRRRARGSFCRHRVMQDEPRDHPRRGGAVRARDAPVFALDARLSSHPDFAGKGARLLVRRADRLRESPERELVETLGARVGNVKHEGRCSEDGPVGEGAEPARPRGGGRGPAQGREGLDIVEPIHESGRRETLVGVNLESDASRVHGDHVLDLAVLDDERARAPHLLSHDRIDAETPSFGQKRRAGRARERAHGTLLRIAPGGPGGPVRKQLMSTPGAQGTRGWPWVRSGARVFVRGLRMRERGLYPTDSESLVRRTMPVAASAGARRLKLVDPQDGNRRASQSSTSSGW